MTPSDAIASPSPRKKPRPARVRAAITNGTTLHLGKVGDPSIAGRRFADLVRELSDERGGAETLDTAKRSAIRAYSALIVARELSEARLARGEAFDAEVYGQIVDRCDRLFRRMGQPTVTPGSPAPVSWEERIAARRAAPCAD